MNTISTEENLTEQHLKELAEKLECQGLATPALFLLEMYKPLSTVLATLGQSLHPLLFPLFSGNDYQNLIKILEDRTLLEKFLIELERSTGRTH